MVLTGNSISDSSYSSQRALLVSQSSLFGLFLSFVVQKLIIQPSTVSAIALCVGFTVLSGGG